MNTVATFLADGFEEVEALAVVDLCRRAGINTILVSVTEREVVVGSHEIAVTTDKLLKDLDFDAVDMIFLPGGMPGTVNLENCKPLMEQIKSFDEQGKCISAICAAPRIFGRMGLLQGRNACSYPAMEEDLTGAEVSRKPVEVSEHITTSRGMGTAIDLGLAIVERFCGKEKADNLAEAIIYNR